MAVADKERRPRVPRTAGAHHPDALGACTLARRSGTEVTLVDHEAIEVRAIGPRFHGVFATRAIEEGAVLWAEDADDPRYHREEIATWPADMQAFFLRWSYQIDDDWFAGPRTLDEVVDSDYMNHSCDPNAWWAGQRTIVARRAIAAGEQITFDYATSESRPDYAFPCRCGTACCRGIVRGDDYLNVPELRARYGDRVQPFLVRRTAGLASMPSVRKTNLSWLHDAIELRPSPTAGYGLFATRAIDEGTVVWRGDPDEPRIHRDRIAASTPAEREFYRHFACQIDDDWFTIPPAGADPEPADFMNHSCDPTTWYADTWTLVARRPIGPGEEITYDYATSETSPEFLIDPCRCGTARCRGAVGPTDYVDSSALQELYGDHVLPYLKLRALRLQASTQLTEA